MGKGQRVFFYASFFSFSFFKDVVDSHTGLAFLKEASDFHSRYITTVRNSSSIFIVTVNW